MLKQMEGRLTAFTGEFGPGNASEQVGTHTRSLRLQTIRRYLPSEEYLTSFSECQTLYRMLLEQDRAFQYRQKKNWHREEVRVLVFMVSQFYLRDELALDSIDPDIWARISAFLAGRSPDDCKFKWLSLSRNPTVDYAWEPEEESLLRSILLEIDYENKRPRWNKIAKEFNMRSHRNNYLFRSSRELKKKWITSICPVEKGQWRKQEDLMLFESVRDYGKKWSYISKLMRELRTENGVKNRFLSVVDKEINSGLVRRKNALSEEQLVLRIISKIRTELGVPEKSSDQQKGEKYISVSDQNYPQTGLFGSSIKQQTETPQPEFPVYGQLQYILHPLYYQPPQNMFTPPVYVPVVLNWQAPQATHGSIYRDFDLK